jgi:integrase
MPTKKLTDLFVERARAPASGRVEYFDASFPGLALRVTDKGAKSWSVFYRFSGRLRRLTLGSWPAIKPAKAREEAQAALDRVRDGIDPAEDKRARRELRTPETDTFGAVAADFLERHARRNNRESTFLEAKRDLERDALRKWRTRPIGSITRRDVIDLIDGILERGAPVQANRTLIRLGTLFNWAIEKERLTVSPVARMKRPTEEKARDRVLSDEELHWFWQACGEVGWPFGHLSKLLLLTAQRRDEVATMTWPEFDLDKRVWTIPREKTKNDLVHDVQLSDTAVAVLQSIKRPRSRRLALGFVFTTTGETSVSGFSRAKRRFDAAMLQAKRQELGKRKDDAIPNWTLHDLRRTAATGMAKLNFPPHVVDKVLNHTSGTIRGVAAIYNRFAYLDERRAALEAWGRYVENLTAPAPAKVVRFSQPAAGGERNAERRQANDRA